ncbi:MAG: hypothetical protein IPK83_25135 [Planctomycetes bacterium]|nr:hypothetical protein [Planctomycetota bacterium]
MKIRCPRCEKMLTVPDKYAGKAIRCPGCNQAFKVPALTAAVGGGGGLDLEDLARLEQQGGSQLSEEELAAHAANQQSDIDAEADAKGFRHCRQIGTKPRSKAKDPYVELLAPIAGSRFPRSAVACPASADKKSGRA